MSRPTLEDLITNLDAGNLIEVAFERVELKAEWTQEAGKDISAIANHISLAGGWLVVGW